jgi:uncharacterized membrane protein
MNLSDWLLALHLIAAAVLVGGMVWFTTALVAVRRASGPAEALPYFAISRLSAPLTGIGSLLVLILGIWLAFDRDDYNIWDPWIIAAIVLWAIGMAAGGRAGKRFGEAARLIPADGQPGNDLLDALRTPEVLWLQLVSLGAVALILLDMIFKPGA